MTEQKFCQNCNQADKCQEAYRRLSNHRGPSVVLKVVAAFVLPLLVFITVLAAVEKALALAVETEQLRTILGLGAAVSVTCVLTLIIRVVNKKLKKD